MGEAKSPGEGELDLRPFQGRFSLWLVTRASEDLSPGYIMSGLRP